MYQDWLAYEQKVCADARAGWEHEVFDPIKLLLEEETNFITHSIQIDEGEPCSKCKSKRTYTWQKQVRRADEGFTSFTICFDCNYQLVE